MASDIIQRWLFHGPRVSVFFTAQMPDKPDMSLLEIRRETISKEVLRQIHVSDQDM